MFNGRTAINVQWSYCDKCVTQYESCGTWVTCESARWLLMAWCNFSASTSAAKLMTQAGRCVSAVPRCYWHGNENGNDNGLCHAFISSKSFSWSELQRVNHLRFQEIITALGTIHASFQSSALCGLYCRVIMTARTSWVRMVHCCKTKLIVRLKKIVIPKVCANVLGV